MISGDGKASFDRLMQFLLPSTKSCLQAKDSITGENLIETSS